MKLRHILIAAAMSGLAVPAVPASAATHPAPQVNWWASGTCNKTHKCVYHQEIVRNPLVNGHRWWQVRAEAICSDDSVWFSDWHRALTSYMTAPASGCGGPSVHGFLLGGYKDWRHKAGATIHVRQCYSSLASTITGTC